MYQKMIEINNLTANRINERFLKKVAKIVLNGEKKGFAELSIVLVKQKKIKELNKKYRGKNRATDVLSFGENRKLIKPFLSEIVICPEEVKKNAERFGLKLEKELALVLIHGILHLLGYNHEGSENRAKEMEKKQKLYLNKAFKSNS